ncbi:MAG: response regulator, partial [Dehalococcoidia bacterium]
NATNRVILEEMLRNWGMTPESAPGARDALRLLDEAQQAGRPFALVLSDVHMPEMDGFALVEEIKKDPTVGSTVIMMLTSGDHPGDIARCEKMGVAAYLLKPVKQSELLEAIMMALGVTTAEDEKSGLPVEALSSRIRPLRILLAEDSLVNQKLAIGLLSRQGHSVSVANNGKEALAALQIEPYDLLIMDVQMPEMDGLEATAAIRALEKETGAHIPIIAMTAHAMKGDRERCLAAGMDQYLTKPIRARHLYDVIEGTVVSLPQSNAATDTPSTKGNGFDLDEALRTVKGDRDLLEVVVETVLEETPRLLEAIRRSIADGDPAALRLAAHTLKGSIRYFGQSAAYEHAYRLEKIGREGPLEDAGEVVPVLEGEMARLTAILLNYGHRNDVTGDP